MHMCAVVMAGGAGTRLWPLSREAFPKQFLPLNSESTMLQETVNRLNKLDIKSLITICNEEHRFFVAEQLREIDKLGSIILEPARKNTAPAIALAAFHLMQDDPLLLVLAADHVIEDEFAFARAVSEAVPLAESGKLVTFGVVPQLPHAGYGYIKRGVACGAGFAVEKFVEKPPLVKAEEYFNTGEYYWNSGMFLFRASRYLEELKKFRPEIYEACKLSLTNMESDLDFLRVDKQQFDKCSSDSVDYAVMERTEDAVVVPMDAGWSDVGSWLSLWDISKKDQNGNYGFGDVILHDSKGCYARAENKLVSLLGVEDLVVIDTTDALMIAHKSVAEDAKIIAHKLKEDKRSEWKLHREVYRPWGKYDSVDKGEGYQVKRITVKPGAKLSVQMHQHRAEHWVVVSGLARVTNGDKVIVLHENESTYIPIGVVHSLENIGESSLELIEVQVGSYLGEDDIVRFEDKYGRL